MCVPLIVCFSKGVGDCSLVCSWLSWDTVGGSLSLWIKGAVLFRRGQYCTGILLPPGAEVFRYIIAPRQLCTGIILPPGRNQGRQYHTATPVHKKVIVHGREKSIDSHWLSLIEHATSTNHDSWFIIKLINSINLRLTFPLMNQIQSF